MDRNVVFMHVPKAGGTSYRSAFSAAFSDLTEFPQERLHNVSLFTQLDDVAQPMLFQGHLGFEFAKSCDALSITILRDPIERLLSLYSYYRDPGRGVPLLRKEVFGDLSLTEFLTSEEPAIRMNTDNQQVWQVGFGYLDKDRRRFQVERKKDDHIVRRAIRNLRDIAVVGVLEEPDRFAKRFREIFGREVVFFSRQNESSERLLWKDLTAEEKAVTEATCELDWAVYEAARHAGAS